MIRYFGVALGWPDHAPYNSHDSTRGGESTSSPQVDRKRSQKDSLQKVEAGAPGSSIESKTRELKGCTGEILLRNGKFMLEAVGNN